jgi:hypothetical protein
MDIGNAWDFLSIVLCLLMKWVLVVLVGGNGLGFQFSVLQPSNKKAPE